MNTEPNRPFTLLNRGLVLPPEDLITFLRRARELSELGQLEEAAGACEEALRLSPEEPRALHLRGIIEMKGRRYASAVSYLSRSIAADPTQGLAYSNLAGALLESGQPAQALSNAERALQLLPNSANALYHRAIAL